MVLCGCVANKTTTTTLHKSTTSSTAAIKTTTTSAATSSTTLKFNPGRIDNVLMPLVPGTKFTYRSLTAEGKELIEVYVTNQTKTIVRVPCVVVRDTVTLDGKLVEQTLDWYAQNKTGGVWYFGEDSKSYKNGVVVSTAGSWMAGINGSKAGIVMEAKPKVGDNYSQEYSKGVAEDKAKVINLNASVSVPYGTFSGCLVTEEWTPLEPGNVLQKYYAPGVGLVKETTVKGIKEETELINITHD